MPVSWFRRLFFFILLHVRSLSDLPVFVAWLFKSSHQTTEPYTPTTALTNAGLSLANTDSSGVYAYYPPHYVALALTDRSLAQLSRSRCKRCTSKSTQTRSFQRCRCFARSTDEEGPSRLTLWTRPPLGSALRCDILPSRAHKARSGWDVDSHVSYSPSLRLDAVSHAAETEWNGQQTYGTSALLQYTANFEIERTWILVDFLRDKNCVRTSFEGRA
ncbi:hypothetical protein EDB89DRAFT_2033129 [Lactarius sanguifluus]|nr:hypothetical protein EDB89DRAFT_2033129 [Lactarius sanguifluus]